MLVGYVRVSSKKQEDEGFSIPAQIKLLKSYAEKHRIKLVKIFEESKTAGKAGRKAYNEMLSYLREHKINTVLVEKTDRLYRNFKDYVIIDESIYTVHLVKERIIISPESTSTERLQHGFKVLIAKNFIDNLKEETKKGIIKKVKEGYFNAKPPYGYKKAYKDVNNTIIDEQTSKFVKRAFEIYSQGDISLKNTGQQLYNEGYIYKPNYPKISTGQLEDMLKNECYLGFVRHKGKLYQGKHEPIISNRLFERVQLAFNKDNKPKTQKDHKFLYSGLLKCGECGRAITCEKQRKDLIYYHCTGNYGKCENKHSYIRQEIIDKQINEGIQNIVISDDLADYLNKILDESYKDLNIITKEKHDYIKKEISQIKTRQDKLLGLYIDGEIEKDFWTEKNNEYTKKRIELEKQISNYKNSDDDFLNRGIKIIELAKHTYSLYLQQNGEEKRKMLKILFSNTKLVGEKLSYEYNRPFSFFAEINKNKKIYP